LGAAKETAETDIRKAAARNIDMIFFIMSFISSEDFCDR